MHSWTKKCRQLCGKMGGQDLDLQPDPSSNEAIGAFVAMMVVLLFFLVYFCCVPIYHGYKKRKEREQELLNTVGGGIWAVYSMGEVV